MDWFFAVVQIMLGAVVGVALVVAIMSLIMLLISKAYEFYEKNKNGD